MATDFAPSSVVAEKGFTYNPNLSVTVKSDVQKLNDDLMNGDISEDAFQKEIKKILPNFDEDVYSKNY